LESIGRLGRSGWFRTPLVAMRNGTTRIYFDGLSRDFTGIRVNDRVTIVVKRDRGSPARAIPSALSRWWGRDSSDDAGKEAMASSGGQEVLSDLKPFERQAKAERNVTKS
jgi:hypothetical protein